ncbi:MAG: hypothetical protein JO316_17640 [Abitibacteriaceae bacterium]|nr:hypothetical protein [Abditibacteriaceae bacterium]
MDSGGNAALGLIGLWMMLQLVAFLALLLGGIYALFCLGRAASGLDRLASAVEAMVERQNQTYAGAMPGGSSPAGRGGMALAHNPVLAATSVPPQSAIPQYGDVPPPVSPQSFVPPVPPGASQGEVANNVGVPASSPGPTATPTSFTPGQNEATSGTTPFSSLAGGSNERS